MASIEVPKDPQKVQRILVSALHLFAQNKYRKTKVEDIANTASVSKGIVFRYFDNKFGLYLATIEYANQNILNNVDYSVWQDSVDLTELIVRATEYKLKLQIKFPDEFQLLTDVFANVEDFSPEMEEKVRKKYQASTVMTQKLVEPVFKRLVLRDDVSQEEVYNMLNGIMLQIGEETKVFMKNHPNGDLKEMTGIIEHAKGYMKIFERGIKKGN